jgi:hypothetical protein
MLLFIHALIDDYLHKARVTNFLSSQVTSVPGCKLYGRNATKGCDGSIMAAFR